LVNVLSAGEATFKAQLHRPQARTVAAVRVSFFQQSRYSARTSRR
jgi:hypothetical protein